MKHILPLLGLVLLLPTRAACANPPECEINVNVDLTEAGKKIPLPTRANPAYYLPVAGGFQEEGAAVASADKPPPRLKVLHLLAVALAGQGYLVMGPNTPPPSVLLTFTWGSMNPEIDEMGDSETPADAFYNQGQMLALVGGHTLNNLDLYMEREPVMQGAKEDRFFVIVSAYDFAAAQQKKKVLLWRAKMSTPSAHVTFGEVVAGLIKSGAPHFGRETERPVWVSAPLDNQGRVELGELTVKEYLGSGASPKDKAKKP
jgi:hypothetical protein